MKKRFLFFYILIIAIAAVSCSQNEYKEMRVYPILPVIEAARGGESFIAIKVEIPAGFHIYGNPKGPGIGKPTSILVGSADGIRFGPVRYMAPEKIYYPQEKEYALGYFRETKMFVPFKVLKNARTGLHTIHITFDSLMCSYAESGGFRTQTAVCIPKTIRFTDTIRVLPEGAQGSTWDRTSVTEFGLSKAPPGRGGEPPVSLKKSESAGGEKLIGDLHFEPQYLQTGVSGLLEAILFGIIAGFILNFMPCVLPVVSIKVMSFVQHVDKSRRMVFLLGLTFSMGILTSFAVLASLASFFGYMWGGLFQHRIFLIIITGIVFALALSMFGVYTLNIPSPAGRAVKPRENMFADAYIKGLFATLLATPCSGPFLGGTLAWTLSRPPLVIFLVFMCIGLGMSLPYLLLTLNPRLLRFIPKPGPWIKTFEQVMAFLLMFTVIYLIGVFDESSRLPAIAFMGFIAVGFWQYGRFGSIVQTRMRRLASFIVLIGIVAAGYFISFDYLYAERGVYKIPASDVSIERVLENRDSGRISMIDFTAEWCPNCRLVEKTSLYTRSVSSAVKADGVDFMKADVTDANPTAERLLLLFNSRSIPLLVVIPPGGSFVKPIVLRDIYTEGDVLKALKMARKQGAVHNGAFKYRMDVGIE
jgi:thiol:disulfide interchange protein